MHLFDVMTGGEENTNTTKTSAVWDFVIHFSSKWDETAEC
jgi:hypothetical protein